MYQHILTIIAPTLICVLIGYCWQRLRQPFDTQFVAQFVTNIAAPCLIVGTLSKVPLSSDTLSQVIVAVLTMLFLTALAAIILMRLLKLDIRSYFGAFTFPNTANMGMPLCLFAFGDEGLSLAIAVFTTVSLVHFSIGLMVVSGGYSPLQAFKSPVIYAGMIGFLLVFMDWSLPGWCENTLVLVGNIAVPMMLITLGVSLCQLKVKGFYASSCYAALRLLIGFLVGFIVVQLLDLEGVLAGVVMIQSSMPVAVFNYLLSLRYARTPDKVAGMVVMSTFLSFLTLPILLWFVLKNPL